MTIDQELARAVGAGVSIEVAAAASTTTSTTVRTAAPPTTLPDLLAGWAQSLGAQPAFTYLDHNGGAHSVTGSLSWRELDQRVDDVASVLLDRLEPGQRVAILGGEGLDHVVGFLGALRAGVIAVPLFAPGAGWHAGRLRTVLTDCRPSVVLTTRAELAPVCRFVGPYQAVVAIEDIPTGTSPRRPDLDPGSAAYRHYTSDSGHPPVGVVMTHAELVVRARQSAAARVSWLPLFPARWLRALAAFGELT